MDLDKRLTVNILSPFLVILLSVAFKLAGAQAADPAVSPPPPVSAIDFETQIKSLEADPNLPQDIKSSALTFYRQAQTANQQAQEIAAKAAELKQLIEAAPGRVSQLRAELEQPTAVEEALPFPTDVSVEQVQQLANEHLLSLREAREIQTKHAQNVADLRGAGTKLSDTVAQLQLTLRTDDEQLQRETIPGEPDVLTRARQAYFDERRQLIETQLLLHRRQLANYELLLQLRTLERDVGERKVDQLQKQVDRFDALLQQKRELAARDARVQAQVTRAITFDLPPEVTVLADYVTKLRQELETLTKEGELIRKRLRDVENQAGLLENEFASIRQRIAVIGPTKAIGRLLRRRLQELPSTQDYQRRNSRRRTEISRITDRRVDIDEGHRVSLDIDAAQAKILGDVEKSLSEDERGRIMETVAQLLNDQRNALMELDQVYSRQLTQLTALDAAERQLVTEVQKFSGFIHEQLLLIPSLPLLSPADFTALPGAFWALFFSDSWRQVLHDAKARWNKQPLISLAAVLLLVALFPLRLRVPARLKELAGLTRKIRTDSFTHTLKASAYTVLLACPWPFLMVFAGWFIDAPDAAAFSTMIASALVFSGVIFFICSLMRAYAVTDGLDHAHFRCSDALIETLRKQWRVAAWIIVPTAFIITAAEKSADEHYIQSLGRPVFVVTLFALAWFFWRLFGPDGVVTPFLKPGSESWLGQLRRFWFPLLLLSPLALAVLSALGYHYSATELSSLFLESIIYLIGLVLLRDLLLRWVYISERRLRFAAALRQREELRSQREQQRTTDSDAFEVEEPEINYRELGEQGRTLVRAGLLLGILFSLGSLWGDLLPVFSFLNDVQLPFSRFEMIDGIEKQRPVTLSDLTIAILILVVVVFAFRNLAGLLEFTILRHTQLDSGARYAIISLSQYFIIGVGVINALSILGVAWSNLQWLVAALGVGLGFGLQEIVANFVSGIILLIERPIRIGDVVNVGNEMGVVAKIRIRATTILTYEKRELIVPNKEFITSRVLNWTLSDNMNRLLLTIGIAYGSDAGEAMRLIAQAADENEYLLKDPKPVVSFEAFGDSALLLELRCYLGSFDFRLTAKTALHEAIYRKLNEAGIVIAFPQQDVHLDTTKPLEVKWHTDDKQNT